MIGKPKPGETVDFIDFCRSEGRFVKHFDREAAIVIERLHVFLDAREVRLELRLARRAAPPRVGFTATKRIGGAVQRNRVRRRLRALLRERWERIPGRDPAVAGRQQ